MLSKTIECLSMLLICHKEGGFFLFCLLFGVVSASIQPVIKDVVMECLTCKLTINQLHIDFNTKWDKRYYKVGYLWCTAGSPQFKHSESWTPDKILLRYSIT